jgi:hypothetical protein
VALSWETQSSYKVRGRGNNGPGEVSHDFKISCTTNGVLIKLMAEKSEKMLLWIWIFGDQTE